MLPAVKRGKISSKIFQLRRRIFHQNHSFSRRIKADFPQSQAISSLFKSFKPWRSGFLILHEYSQRVYTRRILSHISWPLFFGLLAGVLDEGIQMFADGRGSDVRDVVIDFSGVVFGLLAALFLLLLVRMFHVLRESKTPL